MNLPVFSYFQQNKWLRIPVGFVIAVLFLEILSVGYLFTTGNLRKKAGKTVITSPSPGPVSNFNYILYPKNPDATGRNVYYDTPAKTSAAPFTGVGVYKSSGLPVQTYYIVGSFVRWDPVPGSGDKLIVLEDKLGTHDQNGKLVTYPKIRVGFSTTHNDKDTFSSALGVEDITFLIPTQVNPKENVRLYKFANNTLFSAFSLGDLNKIIRPGDTIIVTVAPDVSKNTDLVDAAGNKITAWLMIRRVDAQQELQAELGRPMNLVM